MDNAPMEIEAFVFIANPSKFQIAVKIIYKIFYSLSMFFL